MLKRVMKNVLLGILVTVMLLFNGRSTALASSISNERIDPNDYPKDTRERYVASLALRDNISYEEADKLERQERALLYLPDEYLRYKTIDKYAGKVDDGAKYSESVYIATEVRYVWSRASNRLVNIENVGGSYLYIPGVSYLDITGGNINVELYSKSARVSQTCSFIYEVKGVSVTVGGDVVSISKSWGTYKITTRAKTFVINIKESDLF